jgi:hypothetical protein
MGRILQDTRVTQSNIEHYITQATKDYSTFLASSPTFCTYFSKNHLKSTYDRSLENVNEVVGADSPVVFDKIENFPIYKIENASFGTEITDFGIAANVTSSAVLLPNTLKPSPDDLFTLEYQNVKKVFIVTDVEQDNFNNSKYYKISFRLSTHNTADAEKQVKEEYTLDYDLIGKVKDPIVKKTAFELALAIEDIIDEITRDYLEVYYNREVSAFVDTRIDPYGRSILDPLNNFFINENKLGSLYKDYRKFHYIEKDVFKRIGRTTINNSLYGVMMANPIEAVKEKLTEFKERRSLLSRASSTRYAVNWFAKTNYYVTQPLAENHVPAPTDEIVHPIATDFLDKVASNDLEEPNPYKQFLIKAFNGGYNESNFHEIPADVGFLDDFADNYYIVPLVLYSLRYYRREVVNGH